MTKGGAPERLLGRSTAVAPVRGPSNPLVEAPPFVEGEGTTASCVRSRRDERAIQLVVRRQGIRERKHRRGAILDPLATEGGVSESERSLLEVSQVAVADVKTQALHLRYRINGVQHVIHVLVDAVLAPPPASRGASMANALLRDDTSSIDHRASSTVLASTFGEAMRWLGPLTT
ncbi:MAG: hypothetical protein ACYDB2_04175 [Acidimicrobiales bacterium]